MTKKSIDMKMAIVPSDTNLSDTVILEGFLLFAVAIKTHELWNILCLLKENAEPDLSLKVTLKSRKRLTRPLY